MKKKIAAAVVMAAFIIAGIALLDQFTFAAKNQVASLSSVKGKVAVKAKGEAEWKAAFEKMAVNEGDMLKTSAGSSVIVKFNDGSMAKIGPLSSMTMGKLGAAGKGGTTQLDVDSGKTWARVRKIDSESSFTVKTPTAIAGVRGTFFSTEAEESASTFDVFDGEVAVSSLSNPNELVSVKAHERTSVAANKAPTAPSAIPDKDEQDGRNGFSQEEYTSATFEIHVSITPQVAKPGETTKVSVQVFKNNEPYQKEVELRLALNGSAIFASSGTNEATVSTDARGAVTLDISDAVEESITVDASMIVKVQK